MNDFIRGMGYLMRGITHLTTKGLKRYIILPIFFNVMLFVGLFYMIHHYVYAYSTQYIHQLPTWLSFLSHVFLGLLMMSFFLLFFSMFTIVFNLVAAPFQGLLAEKAQQVLYHSTIPSLSWSEIAIRSVKRQMQFVGYFLLRFFGMCLLFFVPFIQPIYPLLWFLFNAWMLSVQYQDFAMDNNLVSFKDMNHQFKDKQMLLFGFGSFMNVASFIPIFNLFTMPAGVIGGVMMYCEEYKKINRFNASSNVSLVDRTR
ncbi:MAG: sulfate transporter CysZ [Legionella sp.]|nr:MAG: sulfate transporter CysZ [Legionella sp.]